MADKTFYEYFKANMDELGFPAPETLFGTATAATGTISALLILIDQHGPKVSMKELFKVATPGAGGRAVSVILRGTVFTGTMIASLYVGACIGSLAVATAKVNDKEIDFWDIAFTLRTHRLTPPIRCVKHIFAKFPKLWDEEKTGIQPSFF